MRNFLPSEPTLEECEHAIGELELEELEEEEEWGEPLTVLSEQRQLSIIRARKNGLKGIRRYNGNRAGSR
jgi:hypothetical protein